MSDKDSNLFQRETLIDNQLLHTEYQEVNQELRHRNQLLHNTFYLLIIAAGVFLGLFLRFGIDGTLVTLGGLTIATGMVATFIGHLFLKHFHERSSAEVVRMHAEWIANKSQKKAERALSLQWGVAGGGALFDEENNCIVRRGSHVHYIDKWPDQFLSAATVGLFLVYLGAGLIVVGVSTISLAVTSVLVAVITGVVSGTIIILLYVIARKQSRSPGDEPIY